MEYFQLNKKKILMTKKKKKVDDDHMIKIMLEFMSPEFKVRMCWTLVWLKLIEKKHFNPLPPMGDHHRISPYNINTISNRQEMRMKKNIC